MFLIVLGILLLLHLKGQAQVLLLFLKSLGRNCRYGFRRFWRVPLIHLLHVLADLCWIKFSFSFRLRLDVLSPVASDREEWHASIQLAVSNHFLLWCCLSLSHFAGWCFRIYQLVVRSNVDLNPRIGSSILHILILKPWLSFESANLLLLQSFAQLIGSDGLWLFLDC